MQLKGKKYRACGGITRPDKDGFYVQWWYCKYKQCRDIISAKYCLLLNMKGIYT